MSEKYDNSWHECEQNRFGTFLPRNNQLGNQVKAQEFRALDKRVTLAIGVTHLGISKRLLQLLRVSEMHTDR
eukprot:gene6894-7588_t